MKYAKLTEGILEFAPQNKGAIINYNVNVELMVKDGYKEFLPVPRPEQTNRKYHIEYVESNSSIEEMIVFDETQEQADEREAREREEEFKTKFFNIVGYGWYRKQPKGYQSAVESMNVLFNIANVSDGIQAGLIIFYQQPDFTKPEECTEEWLVRHQNKLTAMTKAEFMQLYVAFMTAWNTEEH